MNGPWELNDLPPELQEWFSVDVDQGDKPELHLVGLEVSEFLRCFDVLRRCAGSWSDRTFHIDAEHADVTMAQRPDVAELVARGEVTVACVSTDGLSVNGVDLPLIEMFLYPHEIQFFWRPSEEWEPERVAAFFSLLHDLLGLAPAAQLAVDTRYPRSSRERLGAAAGEFLGQPARVRLP